MSEIKFEKPPLPFLTTIPSGLGVGRKIKIKGRSDYKGEQRFCINFGVTPSFRENVALHISPRHKPDDKCIVVTHAVSGAWGVQQRFKKTVHNNSNFEFKIVVEKDSFKVEFNGSRLTSVPFAFPPHLVNHLEIEGGVKISHIHIEGHSVQELGRPLPPPVYNPSGVGPLPSAYNPQPAFAPSAPPAFVPQQQPVASTAYGMPMGQQMMAPPVYSVPQPVVYSVAYDDCHHHHHHHNHW